MSGIQQIEHLLVIEDRQGKRTIVLEAATCSMGRDPSNTVVLNSQSISRHHALLLRITKPNTTHHSFRIIDGDLQGKRSRHGLKVNDRPCTSHDLQHGDTILFGHDVKARYYVSANRTDVDFLTSCQAEEVSGFLSNLTNPIKNLHKAESSDRANSTEAALERLASIPELNLNPIIEIDLDGNITYLNPAALIDFPELQEQKLAHPALAKIIPLTQNQEATCFAREIQVGDKIYQQNIHFLVSGQLIRSYLVDITEHKQTQEKLKETTALQHAILNSTDRTIITTTVDGTITTFNAAAERLLGYTAAEAIGITLAIIHEPNEIVERAKSLSQELGVEIEAGFEVFVAKARRGGSDEREWTYIGKDGSRFPVLLSVTALRDSEGKITGFLGIGNDLTKRKQAEEALRESEERWQLAVSGTNDGIWDWNIKTNEVVYTPRWKEILEYADHEVANTFEAWETRVHQDDLDRAAQDLQAHLEKKTSFYINEHRLRCKNGNYKWILDRGQALWDEQGNAIRMVGSSTDITERKQTEEALKESERRFRAIFNSMFQFIGLLKPDGTLLEANQTALEFGGITAEEIVGRPLWEAPWWMINPQTQEQLKEAIAKAANGQFVRYEVDLVGVWDTIATIDFSLKPVFDEQEKVVLLISEGREITQRKQAEEALRQSEERFRLLVEYSPVGIFQTDPQGDFLFVNPRWSEITELSSQEALDRGWVKALHREDRQQMFEIWYETVKTGGDFSREFRYQTPKGRITWVFANATAMHDEAGDIIGYLGTVTDISDRKAAEAALKESEERFRLLVDRAPVGIFQGNAQGECLYVNPRWLEMTGLTLEESLNNGWLKPIHPSDRKQIFKEWFRAKQTGDEFSTEFRYETEQGKLGWAFGKAIAIRDKLGTLTGYFGTVTDISARKQVEALLQQSNNVLELRVKQRTVELEAEIAERTRAEEEIRLLQSITKAITEAPNFEQAIAVTLKKVCQSIGWNFAEAWLPDAQDSILVSSSAWYGSTEALLPFREASLGHTFARNTGVPGRVWATRQPEWTKDVSTQPVDMFLRAEIAREIGLKSGLGVPIVANEKVIAVFVFFAFDAHEEDKRMVNLVRSVAKQLGLFIERKRAEDALRSSMATNRALINAIPDWLFRINQNGILVNFKSVKDTPLLFPDREFLDKHIDEVFPAEVAQLMLNCVENALATGETQILECQLPTDSRLRDYEVRIAISAEDEVMAIVRDITERKRREEDMYSALEKEKQLNELKSRFVAMTSHEFRTPLATILSSTELIEHYGYKWSEEKKQQYLQKIQASVKHMTNLLNDVLVLGKAEAGKLDFAPTAIEIELFCRELVEELQLTINSHTIVLQSNKSCSTVSLDEKLLRHILTNLLSNAVKYSPHSDRVDFEVLCHSRDIIFRIRDYGIGIPDSEQDKLFDSFHRASNVGNISGTGLGLAIVKKSVDLHGGTIEMNSIIGEGTTFIVTLPYQERDSKVGN